MSDDELRTRIRAYADLLAGSAGTVPDIDVVWKLRAILGEEPDAEVTSPRSSLTVQGSKRYGMHD